jgi:putative transposase
MISIFAVCSPLCYESSSTNGRENLMPQGLPVLHGADGAGGAGARAHRIRCSVHHWGLARCRQYYQQHGKGEPWAELSVELTQLKQTELWLYDFDSQMLQQALADLRRAYLNFFERRAKFPQFKKKKAARVSFRIPQRVRVENGCVYVPSIGRIRIRQSQAIELPTRSATFPAHRRRALVRNSGGEV